MGAVRAVATLTYTYHITGKSMETGQPILIEKRVIRKLQHTFLRSQLVWRSLIKPVHYSIQQRCLYTRPFSTIWWQFQLLRLKQLCSLPTVMFGFNPNVLCQISLRMFGRSSQTGRWYTTTSYISTKRIQQGGWDGLKRVSIEESNLLYLILFWQIDYEM